METSIDSTAHKDESCDIYQLNGDNVVSKDVRVAHGRAVALLHPLLEAQVEDNDTEREDEEDVGDNVGSDAHGGGGGVQTFV